MTHRKIHSFRSAPAFRSGLVAAVVVSGLAGSQVALGDDDDGHLFPGNLLVSRSVYDNKASIIAVGTPLPPGCVTMSFR